MDENKAKSSQADEAPKKSADDDMFSPKSEPPQTSKIFTTFAWLAMPNIITNVLGFLSNAVIIIYAGRTDDSMNVAVMGLAGSCCSLLISSLVCGLNSA